MTQKFGKYTIKTSGDITYLNLFRTANDWLAIFLFLFCGVIFLAGMYMMYTGSSSDTNTGTEVVSFFFAFAIIGIISYSIFKQGILKFRTSSKKILEIDKKNNLLLIKEKGSNPSDHVLSDLIRIEYQLFSKKVEVDDDFEQKFWVEVNMVTTYKDTIQMFVIDPIDVHEEDLKKVKKELHQTSKGLCKKLAEELGVKSRRKKEVTIDTIIGE